VDYERLVYPPYNAPLAEAYGGRFESIYVIVHPFVGVPEPLAWKTVKQYPTDEQILSQGVKVPWASVAAQTGLSTCAKVPTEGRFEPLLQTDFLDAFAAAGLDELIFVPEFPHADSIQRFNVSRLRDRRDAFPSRGTLAAPDESFVLTVDWDSFFTLFYGPRAFVAETVRRHDLEGFFATPTTEHFWFNYSLGCCVVTLVPEGWQAG
jgi:hypothetical protein